MQTEEWRDIQGYEGLYKVSNFGHVLNCKRLTFLKPASSYKGDYLKVSLFKDGKGRSISVHRLVAQAFIPNPDNKPQVNHIDNNRQNPRSDNLEWVTAQENLRHAGKLGLMARNRPVLAIKNGHITLFKSIFDASASLSISRTGIHNALKQGGQSGNHFWKYAA
jgi:hypothetical protein